MTGWSINWWKKSSILLIDCPISQPSTVLWSSTKNCVNQIVTQDFSNDTIRTGRNQLIQVILKLSGIKYLRLNQLVPESEKIEWIQLSLDLLQLGPGLKLLLEVSPALLWLAGPIFRLRWLARPDFLLRWLVRPNFLLLWLVRRSATCTEAEFLDVIGTKVFRVFNLSIHSHIC